MRAAGKSGGARFVPAFSVREAAPNACAGAGTVISHRDRAAIDVPVGGESDFVYGEIEFSAFAAVCTGACARSLCRLLPPFARAALVQANRVFRRKMGGGAGAHSRASEQRQRAAQRRGRKSAREDSGEDSGHSQAKRRKK